MAINGTAGAQRGEIDVSEEEVAPVEERVQRAVELIEDGLFSIDDVGAHEQSERSDEEFRAAVREQLDVDEDPATPDQTDDEEVVGQITSADGVDWRSLWEEFGFNSPDAHGKMAKSGTKVEEAIRVSEQGIVGNAKQILDEAVEMDVLHKKTVPDERGEEHPVGYIFMGGGGDE